jgi:putative ABC transport system permease protein
MRWLSIALARVRALFRRDAIADEIREELDFHLDMRAGEYTRDGLTVEAARREAARRLGNLTVLRDRGYDVRGAGMLESLVQDIRYGARSLRQAPTFTAVALIVLALAIGAATAIFSVVDAVLLRGLPYDEHDRIAAVLGIDTRHETTFGDGASTLQTYLDWRRLQQSFDGVAMVGRTSLSLTGADGEPEVVPAQQVTWEFFSVLRAKPLLGRLFDERDELPSQAKVAVLSHGMWLRRFGGDPAVVGKTFRVNRDAWQIVGVMPSGFSYPPAADRPTELYVPQPVRDEDRVRGGSHNYNGIVIGRLKPGVGYVGASDQMNGLAAGLDRQYPKWEPGWRVRLQPLHERLVGTNRRWMTLLLGSVILVLLIACANVANLMLARASRRAREIGIRIALGAGRRRVVRALLVESMLLAVVAGLFGIGLAYGGVHVLRAWLPEGVPRVAEVGVDLRVLTAAVGMSLLTGLLFGLAPAIHASRRGMTHGLKDGGRGATPAAGAWLRNGLVVTEVSVAVVLLVGAGLFVGSFAQLMRIEPGFDYRNTLTLGTVLRRNPGTDRNGDDYRKRGAAHVSAVVDAVRGVPGVISVAAVSGGTPLTGNWSRVRVTLPGKAERSSDEDSLDYRRVTTEYFSLLQLPLLRGRLFSPDDRADGVKVVVINESAARKYWPGRDPLGEQVSIQGWTRLVIGVVADVRHYGPEQPPRQGAFVPWVQEPSTGAELLIRTATNPMALAPAIRSAAWAVNHDQSLSPEMLTLDDHMNRLVAPRRFNMSLIGLLGVLGLVIAGVGIFGVVAYVVSQRTNEFGVRLALGATPRRIVAMVLRSAAVLIGSGLAIGSVAAWKLAALAETFLFLVRPSDLRIFGVAIGVLAVTGVAAAIIPARRAAAVDPLTSLRT